MNAAPKAALANDLGTEHDGDLVLWSCEQARLLEDKRFDDLDLTNLIDEVRALGASEKREIRNRLSVLLMHLLKWRQQPERRSPSWKRTIRTQRRELAEVLADSPSLHGYPGQVFERAFEAARLDASVETGLDIDQFPEAPPFTVEQALDPDFLPRHPGEPTPEDIP